MKEGVKMKLFKRLTSLLLVLCMLLSNFPVTAWAAEEVASGTCGENVTWTLYRDGLLEISGTGEMDDYAGYKSAPWGDNVEQINSIVIESGITYIGESAFYGCSNTVSVTIPDSVISVGDFAFCYCTSLSYVAVSENVIYIGNYAFFNCSSLSDITIPSGVEFIEEGVFSECTNLRSVVIPEHITSIGDFAFSNCTSLHNITIPESVNSIGISAFSGCDSLISVAIPASVSSIGDSAFAECKNLTGIWVEENNLYYSSDSYGSLMNKAKTMLIQVPCGLVGSYSISDGVISIGDAAFAWCEKLTDVTISGSVSSIGLELFNYCSRLETIEIDETNNVYKSIDGVMFNKAGTTLLNYPAGRYGTYSIPDGVDTIESAFYDCKGLTGVTLPDSIVCILGWSFTNCSSLTNIIIPENVISIGYDAFSNCSNLTQIKFMGSAPDINENAFSSVSATAYYPADDTTWTDEVKQNYSGSISWEAVWSDIPDESTPSDELSKIVDQGTCGENVSWILYRDGLLEISGSGAMDNYDYNNYSPWDSYRNEITGVIIGDGVTSIGNRAFRYCENITNVTISDSVERIEASAFAICSSLESVEIPDGVTFIGEAAFIDCASLISISIPESVTDIGAHAFARCMALADVTLLADLSQIREYTFDNCRSMTDITIPDGVTDIGNYAFNNCISLTDIVIPEGVTSIGERAFFYCENLKAIEFKGNAPTIGEDGLGLVTATAQYPGENNTWTSDVMQDYGGTITWESVQTEVPDEEPEIVNQGTCGVNVAWILYEDGLLEISGSGTMDNFDDASAPWYGLHSTLFRVVIEEGVTSIGNNAFWGCNALGSVSIPNSVESIGSSAFSSCEKLVEITIPDSVKSIGPYVFSNCDLLESISLSNQIEVIAENAFRDCPSLKYIDLPSGLSSIGVSAFSWCDALESITIPSTVTTIDDHAFQYCTALKGISIPENVKSIGGYVFWGCSKLESATMGNSVTSMGNDIFRDCINLTSIELSKRLTHIPTRAFEGCTSLPSIVIPDSVTSIANNVFTDCSSLTSITFGAGLSSINKSAFSGCDSLLELWVPDENSYYQSDENGILYNNNMDTIVRVPTGRQSVNIPEGITGIGDSAFAYCTKLEKLTIPQTVLSIGNEAYYACTSLLTAGPIGSGCNIEFGWKTEIPARAFHYAYELTDILLPSSITAIGASAFFHCWELKNIVLPDSLNKIGYSAFAECATLEHIEIPASVTTTGSSIFQGCELLTSAGPFGSGCNIEFGWNTTIPDYAFSYADYLTSITLPEELTGIGLHAFTNSSYFNDTSNWTDTVLYIGTWLIDGTDKPTDSIMGNGYTTGECIIKDGTIGIADSAFRGCYRMTRVVFPDSVKYLGNDVFYSCSGLCEMTLPSDLVAIGENSFYNCTGLTNIEIPDGTSSIGTDAFCACSNLTQIVIPVSITYIGRDALSQCGQLADVYFGGSQEEWEILTGKKYSENDYPYRVHFSGDESEGNTGNGNVRYFQRWDAEKQIAYFDTDPEEDFLNFGSQVTEATDTSFLAYVDQLVGNYVLVATQPRDDGMLLPDTLLSIIPAETFTGTVSNVDDSTFTIDGTVFPYDPSRITMPTLYNNSYVRYHLLDGTIVGIACINKPTEIDIIEDLFDEPVLILRPYALETTAKDWFREYLPDITAQCDAGEFKQLEKGFVIEQAKAELSAITLSKDGYREYIIPANVSKYLSTDLVALNKNSFDVYMQKDRKDGKPYISTVFCKESGTDHSYVEIKNTKLIFEEGLSYDFCITCVGMEGKDVTYYIGESDGTRISSTSGVFSTGDLFDTFDYYTDLYVYAVASDGSSTEAEKVKLEKMMELSPAALNFLDSSTISLFGANGVGLKIGENVPVFGGSELKIKSFETPIGIDITGTKVRITVGIDLYQYTNNIDGKSRTKFYEAFKKQIKTLDTHNENLNGTKDTYEKFFNRFLKQEKLVDSYFDFSIKVKPELAGYIEADLVGGEMIVSELYISIGGEFKYEYTRQVITTGPPAYIAVEIKVPVKGEVSEARVLPDSSLPLELSVIVKANPSLKLMGGLGIKDLLSVGIYGEGTADFMADIPQTHLTLDVTGEFGLEMEFFMLSADLELWKGTANVANYYWGSSPRTAMLAATSSQQDERQTIYTVQNRDYIENTSEWLGESPNISTFSAVEATAGMDMRILQTGVFSHSNAQIAKFDDTMIMVWIEDDITRDSYNRMRLVYSVYDPVLDTWNEPKSIWDDGNNDGYPSLASDGSNVYVTWQKITKTLTESDCQDIGTLLENSEICVARYDTQRDAFVEVRQITDNTVYDYSPVAVVENNQVCVYYASCSGNDLYTSGMHSLYRYDTDAIAKCISSGLNYILSMDACFDKVSYSMDADGNYNDSTDINVFTVTDEETTAWDNAGHSAITMAAYAIMNGEQTLFVSDGNNVYYEENGKIKKVFDTDRSIGDSVSIVDTDNGIKIIWTEYASDTLDVYVTSYVNKTWSEPVAIYEQEENLYGMDAVCYHNNIVGTCNIIPIRQDQNDSAEARLCVFSTNEFTDLQLEFPALFDESSAIPGEDMSFGVIVQNNGTQTIQQIEFTVTDTLGSFNSFVTQVEIPAGEFAYQEVIYPVPENYGETTLTVSAIVTNSEDTNIANNLISLEIGRTDLATTQPIITQFDHYYLVQTIVENKSAVTANNIQFNATMNEENGDVLFNESIDSLSRGEHAIIEVAIAVQDIAFDENGTAKVFLNVQSENTDAADGDNTQCTLLVKSAFICSHSNTTTNNATDANCTESGYTGDIVCNDCGKTTEWGEVIPATGHSFTNYVSDGNATCTEDGTKTAKCDCCEERDTIDDVGSVTDHSYGEWTEVTAATCTEKGEERRDCVNCDAFETQEVDAKDHEYSEHVTEASCTEKGYTTFICECGDSYVGEYVDVLAHRYGEWKAEVEATCTERGEERRYCVSCDTAYETRQTEATGDSFSNYISDDNATCTADGTKTATCDNCDATNTVSDPRSATGHDWDNGNVTKEPAIGVEGIKTFTCANCGETKTESIPALPDEPVDEPCKHTSTKLVNQKDATCTATGYTGDKVCSVCDETVGKGTSISMKAHTEVIDKAVAATCTASGKTEGKRCSVCQTVLVKQETIPATGHSWGDWEVTKPATSAEMGEEKRSCTVCGLEETRSIDKLSNPFVDVQAGKFYETPVLWAVENGVTNGMDATHFAPNDKCTRAQVVTFLWRAAGAPEPASTNNPFVDVVEGKFYYKAVLWAVEEGITNGVDATHFGTNDECTRGHVATFLWRTLGKPTASSSTNPFGDVVKGKFYYDAVLWAAESGVTTGISAGKFDPAGTCTRGQIVTFLYRALG